jgi:hypothetical protein
MRNQAGCSLDSSAMVSITLNPVTEGNNNALIPATSTPAVCSGNTAIVSLSGFSGNVIKWIYRDSVINGWSTISNQMSTLFDNNTFVSYNRVRTYRAIVYNAANCSNDTTAEVQLNLKQQLAGNAPGITPTSNLATYCSATAVQLNVTGFINGGVVTGWLYSDNGGAWQLIPGSGGFSYTHTNTLVTGLTSRSYRALALTGCSTDTTSALTVTLDANPAKPLITQSNDSLVSSVAGSAYVWKLNGTTLAGNTQKIAVTASGNYTVEVSNASGCKATSDAFNYIHPGMEEAGLAQFTSVYPNPTVTGEVNIALSNVNAQKANIRIMDMLGQVIDSKDVELSNGEAVIRMNISAAASGIYFVTVTAGNENITRRVVFNKQ